MRGYRSMPLAVTGIFSVMDPTYRASEMRAGLVGQRETKVRKRVTERKNLVARRNGTMCKAQKVIRSEVVSIYVVTMASSGIGPEFEDDKGEIGGISGWRGDGEFS